ncbi:GyrI-like domain-containing protein [Clostridium sp.]|uniref:GyrI-like domain-containing protein n=1 Tax=Clostridium sp. TaxID=1506 RepID=UPI003217FFED
MVKTKLDLKKEQKEIFNVKQHQYKKVTCPKSYYIAIDGKGNPNGNEEYMNKIGALYKVAYGLKMKYKKYDLDFVVMPLSGLWWTENMKNFENEPKENWLWTMMIQIPKYLEKDEFNKMKISLKDEEMYKYVSKIYFAEFEEEEAFETLYIGAYKDEGSTIKKLHETILEEGYKLCGKHHEIYLSDPRKVEESKLKTIIRQSAARI